MIPLLRPSLLSLQCHHVSNEKNGQNQYGEGGPKLRSLHGTQNVFAVPLHYGQEHTTPSCQAPPPVEPREWRRWTWFLSQSSSPGSTQSCFVRTASDELPARDTVWEEEQLCSRVSHHFPTHLKLVPPTLWQTLWNLSKLTLEVALKTPNAT